MTLAARVARVFRFGSRRAWETSPVRVATSADAIAALARANWYLSRGELAFRVETLTVAADHLASSSNVGARIARS